MKPRSIRLLHAVSFVVATASVSLARVATAQDSAATSIAPVVVTVARGSAGSVLDAPFALTVITPDSTRPGGRHVAVDETLALIPGLTANSRSNPSQDPRLSIRGFGARSAFGVRGVRVLRDGMPLTLPDGQTPLDYMSLESVGRVEVMRGAASALYGNASGGVIEMKSFAPASGRFSGDIRQWFGNDGFKRTVAAASGTAGRLYYQGDAARTRTLGARDHSRQRATSVFARGGLVAGRGEYSISVLGLDMPEAQNPGALTLAQMRADASAADSPSVAKRARKAVKQVQAGISANGEIDRVALSGSVFAGARSLDNPLTFGIVEVGRHSHGASTRASSNARLLGVINHFSAGADLQWQNDLRRNYSNCNEARAVSSATAACPFVGIERGTVTLDQRELVSSAGIYAVNEADLGERIRITAGLRADRVRFEVRDRLTGASNPDDSGERSLQSVTPIAGMLARLAATHSLYANISSAFETPTATELGNQPDGSAGINRELNPQRSTTLEAGLKGIAGLRLRYDVAVYSTRVTDELVPFEIPGGSGRRYFRNAGRTNRDGGEAGLELRAGRARLSSAYSYSRFRFDRYSLGGADYAGNHIPGAPRHRFQAAVASTWSRGFAVADIESARRIFADDANTVVAPAYGVANLRTGLSPLRSVPRLSLTAGVQNLFDRTYAPSIVVNAAREKYFEPAPSRSIYAGISVGGGW
ncbi:MAG: TonB-dependent receptor [Gemmatimonadaceae bacterium]|nr:TonB-dependent receptor [Gemmatimonadaceae bacterium]